VMFKNGLLDQCQNLGALLGRHGHGGCVRISHD
jgi:hypothetical protein